MKYNVNLIVLTIFTLLNVFSGCSDNMNDSSPPIGAPEKDCFVILYAKPSHGMFSVFDHAVDFLDAYDKNKIAGLDINFEETGIYYDPHYGPNWWTYYHQPISIGNKSAKCKVRVFDEYYNHMSHTEFNMSRTEVHSLIKKYFHIQPRIQTKIDSILEKEFSGSYVIGVHYRGTDKISEAPRVPYEKVVEEIDKVIASLSLSEKNNYRVYVATDEAAFLDYVKPLYEDKLIYLCDAARSTTGAPVHLDRGYNRYLVGENALMDSILLSKTNIIIRTSSNLSRWSTYFNPDLPVIELSKRFQ